MSARDLDAFLATIDEITAPTCGACTKPLDPDGPSAYYCDDICSDRWHATQAEPLVGYREPWRRPEDFPGVGQDGYSTQPDEAPADLTIQRSLLPWADQLDEINRGWLQSIRMSLDEFERVGRVYVVSNPSPPADSLPLADPSTWTEIGHTSEPLTFQWPETVRTDGAWLSDTEDGPLHEVRFDRLYLSLSTAPPPEAEPQPEVSASYSRVSVTWEGEQ